MRRRESARRALTRRGGAGHQAALAERGLPDGGMGVDGGVEPRPGRVFACQRGSDVAGEWRRYRHVLGRDQRADGAPPVAPGAHQCRQIRLDALAVDLQQNGLQYAGASIWTLLEAQWSPRQAGLEHAGGAFERPGGGVRRLQQSAAVLAGFERSVVVAEAIRVQRQAVGLAPDTWPGDETRANLEAYTSGALVPGEMPPPYRSPRQPR